MDREFETYLVTQENLSAGRSTESIVTDALAGGVDAVQVREKDRSAADQLRVARALREPTAEAGVALVVNDRVDVAVAAAADGVHLGQDDLPVETARQQLGEDAIIGQSVSTVEEATVAEAAGADYLGVGTIYNTDSKDDAGAAIGLDAVEAIADAVEIPLVGIGGVTPERAPDVAAAGADGAAVITAITQADDPAAATRELASAIADGKRRREGAAEMEGQA
ncbi:thiamine phosphate synthase [Halobacteriaceae bacterium SHR40]|uniref:thiamine phosphate synthase n=1 Tax=Halovenus amylolytica TaxID=2500550 RepID=UPI000FE38BCE